MLLQMALFHFFVWMNNILLGFKNPPAVQET